MSQIKMLPILDINAFENGFMMEGFFLIGLQTVFY